MKTIICLLFSLFVLGSVAGCAASSDASSVPGGQSESAAISLDSSAVAGGEAGETSYCKKSGGICTPGLGICCP
jgi:hypothetical protein